MLQAFFCDDAAAPEGKLHIHGIYNELMAEGFPARQERLVLCGIIEWQPGDAGKQPFAVDLLDPNDQSIFTVEGHTDVTDASAGRAPARTNLVLPLENVVFPVAGRYRSRFRVRDKKIFGPDLFLFDARKLSGS
ncbi:MAG: hypothetical protein KJO35_03225 [Gammaproteobacteria bacterium]|nr:hypothetical protein [Gammaproteobacteria bacterium]